MLSAAASARLCVETFPKRFDLLLMRAAASARLCVETETANPRVNRVAAAASARLCVETRNERLFKIWKLRSRLRAAVC